MVWFPEPLGTLFRTPGPVPIPMGWDLGIYHLTELMGSAAVQRVLEAAGLGAGGSGGGEASVLSGRGEPVGGGSPVPT